MLEELGSSQDDSITNFKGDDHQNQAVMPNSNGPNFHAFETSHGPLNPVQVASQNQQRLDTTGTSSQGPFSFNSKMIKKPAAGNADGKQNLVNEDGEEGEEEVKETEELKDNSLKASRELLIPHEPNAYRKEKEAMEMNETDVYPIRISLSPKQILRMKFIRIIAFICCFYFIVPFDLYIKDQHLRRIWLYDTDYYYHSVVFSNYTPTSNQTFAYHFDLTNCKVYLMQSDSYAPHTNTSLKNYTKQMAFELEFGFTWGTPFHYDDQGLKITSSEDQNCIVNVWASPHAIMPKLTFTISGAQDNLMFQDNTAEGVSLDLSNGLEIQGSKVFVTLGDHTISNLTVVLQYGIVLLNNIDAPIKFINITEGIYKDVIPNSVRGTTVSLNQPEGNICIASQYTNPINKGRCDPVEKNILASQLTGNYSCLIDATICFSKAACSKISYTATIIVTDGQIQLSYANNKTKPFNYDLISRQVKGYDAINFTLNAFSQLNESVKAYKLNEDLSRISRLQVIGSNYQATWMYTNKKVYFQANYWTLIWASAGLLKPSIDSLKLLMIDSQCPNREPTISLDAKVSDYIKNMYPLYQSSDVAFANGLIDTVRVILNSFGEYEYQVIAMEENPLLVAAFALSAVIALFGGLFSVFAAYKFYMYLKRRFNQYVQKRKNLSITLKIVKAVEQKVLNVDEEILGQINLVDGTYEKRGIFNSKLVSKARDIKKYNLAFSFSLYQIPAMLLDHFFRKQTNSMIEFLSEVPEDTHSTVFSRKRMRSYDKTNVSLPLYEFQQIYSRFCNINGFNEQSELDNETNTKILKAFGITFLSFDDTLEPAYANIRLKTLKEMSESRMDQEQLEQMTSAQRFLNENCIATKFRTDVISFQELKYLYDDFCKINDIPYAKKTQIVGSEDMINFGAVVVDVHPPKRLLGIKKMKTAEQNTKGEVGLLLRQPSTLRSSLMTYLLRTDGLIPNVLIAVIHFLLILVVPIISPFIAFYALILIPTFQGNVFAKILTIKDFFSINRMDPWWNNVPNVEIVLYIHAYVLVYLIFAYFEIFSYYLTGFYNNGKYVIMYSFARRFIMINFYIGISFFLFLYIMMAIFTIQWGILGAIFNPTALLPYSAAIVTFIATVGAKFNYFKQKYENLSTEIEIIVKEKIGYLIIKSLEKIKSSLGQKYASLFPEINEQAAQEAIEKGMNQVLELETENPFDLEGAADKAADLAKTALMNNASALANLISGKVDGLDPSIIELIIAVAVKNDTGIKDSIDKLAVLLGVEASLLHSFIALASANVKAIDEGADLSKPNLSQVVQAVKQIFRHLHIVDERVSTALGNVCKVLIEGDSEPIMEILEEYMAVNKNLEKVGMSSSDVQQIVQDLLGLLLSAVNKVDPSNFRKNALDMINSAYENEEDAELEQRKRMSVNNTIELLERLKQGDIYPFLDKDCYAGIDKSKGIIGFTSAYPVLVLIDVLVPTIGLSNQVLTCGLKEIMVDLGLKNEFVGDRDVMINNFNTSDQYYSQPEKLMIALNYITRGPVIDLEMVAVQVNGLKINLIYPDLDGDILQNVASLNGYSRESFNIVVKRMGLAESKNVLMDIYDLMLSKYSPYTHILEKLELRNIFAKNFFQLVQIFKSLQEYQMLCDEYKRLNANIAIWERKLKEIQVGVFNKKSKQFIKRHPHYETEIKDLTENISKSRTRLNVMLGRDIWNVRKNIGKFLSKISSLEEKDYSQWVKSFKSSNRRVYGRALDQYKQELRIARSTGKTDAPLIEKKAKPTAKKINAVDIESNSLLEGHQGNDQVNDELNESLHTQEDEAIASPDMIASVKPHKRSLKKSVNIFINFQLDSEQPGNYYLNEYFYNQLLQKLCAKEHCKDFEAKEDLTTIFYLSTLVLRVEGKLPREVDQMYEALENIADLIGVDEHQFELIIDFIIGDPRDVFRTQKNQEIKYDLDKIAQCNEYCKTLDTARLKNLQKLFKGSDQALAHVFLHWYHQQKMMEVQKKTVEELYIGQFGIKKDFITMLAAQIDLEKQRVDEFEGIQALRKKINAFISNNFTLLALGERSKFEVTGLAQPISDATYKSDFKNPFSNDVSKTMLLLRVHQFFNGMNDEVLSKILEDENALVHNLLRNYLNMNMSRRVTNVMSVVQDSAEYLTSSKYHRQEFIGTQLILNSTQITRIFNRNPNQNNEFVDQFEKLFDGEKFNSLSFGQPALTFEDGDEKNMFQCIFDNTFLDPSIKFLMRPVLDHISYKYPSLAKKGLLNVFSGEFHPVVKQVANNLMGVFLGYSIDDKNILRSSVIELVVNKQMISDQLEGFIAILLGDISCNNQIESFCNKIGISGNMLINLIKILDKSATDLYSNILQVIKEACSGDIASNIASLLSLTHFDVNQIKPILNKIKVKHPFAVPALMAVIAEGDELEEHYSAMRKALKLKSLEPLREIMGLIKGQPTALLNKLSKPGFENKFVRSFYLVQRNGFVFSQQLTAQKAIKEVIFKVNDDVDYLSERMYRYLALGPAQKSKMSLNTRLLIKACWGDQRSLRLLIESMKDSALKDSLWFLLKGNLLKDSAREVRFLKHCLWRLFEYNRDLQMSMHRSKKQTLRLLLEIIIPYIQKRKEHAGDKKHGKESAKDDQLMAQAITSLLNEYLDNDPVTKKPDAKIVELQKTLKSNPNAEQLAIKVGCTFRFTQMNKIHQPMFRCQECKVDVCFVCAELYHKPYCKAENGGEGGEETKNLQPLKETRERHFCNGGKSNLRCKPSAAEQPSSDVVPKEDFIRYYVVPQSDRVGFQDIIYHERLQTYTLPEFISDLSHGLGLERYTEKDISQDGFNQLYDLFDEPHMIKKDQPAQVDIQKLIETKYDTSYTVLENIVLMSFGRVTPSMTNHMLKLEQDNGQLLSANFHAFERNRQADNDQEKLYQYKVLRTLYGIGSSDIEAFDKHAAGILVEAGMSASDIQIYPDLILLASGGELDLTRESLESTKGSLKSLYVNPYMSLFRRLFGNDWKAMISLHRFVQLSPKELQAVFAEESAENQIVTLFEEHDWIFDGLFKDYMGMTGKSAGIMQGLVALMSKDKTNAAGLWKLIKVPESKASKYLALILLEDLYDVAQIGNLAIPEILSSLLVNGLARANTTTIADFAAKYLNRLFKYNYFTAPDASKSKLQIDWLEELDERIDLEVEKKRVADPKVFMAHHTFYLKKVIELMSNDIDSNPIVNLQYVFSVAHGCQNRNDKINLALPATQLYRFQYEEKGEIIIRPEEAIQINEKDATKLSQIQNDFLVSTIAYEAIQGIELCAEEFLTLLYVNSFILSSGVLGVPQKEVEGKQKILLQRIGQIRQLLTAPELDIKPDNVLKMLKDRKKKEKFLGGMRRAEYEMPSDLDAEDIEMISLLINSINQADIVIATRVVDLMTSEYSKNYFKSAISKLTTTAPQHKRDSTSEFFDTAIKRSFARLFENGIREEFKNLPVPQVEAALKQGITEQNVPLILGCSTTLNKDVIKLFMKTVEQALVQSAIKDDSGQDFNVEAFLRLISPDSDDKNITSYMSFVCRGDFQKIADDSKKGIIKLIINNAGKLPMAREIFQSIKGMNIQFALPKEVTDLIKQVAKTAGVDKIPNFEQEISEFGNQVLSSILRVVQFDQVLEILSNPGSVVAADFSAKLDKMMDLSKVPNLKVLLEKEYNIEREVRKYMETFFKQMIKNMKPFYAEVQAYFVNQLYQCFNGTEISLRNLKSLLSDYIEALLDFDPDLQKVIRFISYLIQKEPLLAIDNIDGFLNITFKVTSAIDDVADGAAGDASKAIQEAQKKFEESVKPLIVLIKQWMKVVSLSVGQESPGASKGEFKNILVKSLTDALDNTQAYLVQQKILTPDHPLQHVFSKLNLIKAAITAIVSLSQGNYEGIESLAVILGGVPAKEGFQRLKQAIQVIQANKDGITFNSVKAIAASNMDLAMKAIPIKIPGIDKIEELIQKGIDNPASLVEPKTFFDLFKNEKGVIGLDEFKNIFNQLGINMPHATILQVFSVADIEKKGELTFQEFAKALSGIKEQLVQKFVVELGFSINEMIMSIVFTAFMLILQFVFIFIGMSAFSPTTTFSSVVNSLMALGASFAAKGNDQNQEKSADDVKDQLDVTKA